MTLDPTFDYHSTRKREGTRPPRPPLRSLIAAMAPEQRLAAIAAIGMVASLVLPWWQQPSAPHSTNAGLSHISFIELAMMLVCAAVVALLYRRAEGREFHMPLADGTLAALAGLWCGFLLIFRMFDAPSIEIGARSEQYDPHWGIAIAFGLAAVLFASGVRGRQHFHGGTSEAMAADQDASPTAPLPPN